MQSPKTSRFAGGAGGSECMSVLGELSRSLFDDAMVTCDDEREAAILASARLLLVLESKERERARAAGGR
ncbi:MAG: hypothetical protein DIU72_004780 [Pseudomonadota bacterium]|nr:MAG: hypothetical protein DIU72_04775 [Pseudomonadota bacterium]